MVVALIIPARNESAALSQVLAELPWALLRQVVVVDNGSTDGTAHVAEELGASVVSEPTPGYGRACLAGIAALDRAIETVIFMDGDHSDYPEDIAALLAPIERGQADLVIGSRIAQAAPGSLTIQQRLGNALACFLLRRYFGCRYTDLGPFRVIRREALERLRMQDRAFGWTVEMQAKAALAGLRIAEVPVRYRRRIGRSKISGTISGTVRAGLGILSTIARVKRAETPGSLAATMHAIEEPPEVSAHPQRTAGRRLLIFAKSPEPGRVKTRLAEQIGAAASAEVYRACVEMTLERLRRFQPEAVVHVDPPESIARMRAWLGEGWELRPQQGETLGARLAAATHEAFEAGVSQVVVIGTDSPWLPAGRIDEAFEALATHQVAAGPTEDGGYYLIGLSTPAPEIFAGIDWSTPRVYAQTVANSRAAGLTLCELPLGYDVDRVEDVERLVSDERQHELAPPQVERIRTLSQRRVECQS